MIISREMPNVACKTCHAEFYAKPFWIRRGYGKYCSPACQYEGRKAGAAKPCHICSKSTYKKKRQLDASQTGLFFCGRSCQAKWRNQVFFGPKHSNWKEGRFSYRSVLIRNGIEKVCTLCETKDARVLAVHHRDRDHRNNELSNLAWLCHNCHFLIHHDECEMDRFEKKFQVQRK